VFNKPLIQRLTRHRILLRLRQATLDPVIEIVLHPSLYRFRVLGGFTVIGQIVFWYLWTAVYPQPYENMWVRLALCALGLGLFYEHKKANDSAAPSYKYVFAVFWLQLPVFFTWMYWMNEANTVWLGSMACMVLIYYHFTDWRLASLGLLAGVPLATFIAHWQLGVLPEFDFAETIVLLFGFLAAMALGASNANLRRQRLQHSLAVMGIMAHELRTPLATLSMVAQAISNEIPNTDEKSRTRALNKLTKKIESLAVTINHHIDIQMMNARLMQLPSPKDLISARGLVNKVATQYPFSSRTEENSVEIFAHEDFMFYGSERQYIQVLNNLIKNAIYTLKAAQSTFSEGAIRIELGARAGRGRISVSDKGMGIKAQYISHIFEPFYSTTHDTGHGLGLAYCRQVVEASGGSISVRSEPNIGSTFSIEIPIQDITVGKTSSHAISSLPQS
jgi:two-component system, CAI-1 autoinducer sensor kinase/phosphatase CqsS